MIRHTKHYFRAAFFLVAGLLLFILLRFFLIPPSFGKYGFYRGDNIEEQMNHAIASPNMEVCSTCHSDVWETHQKGPHAAVQCQNCHDILPVHINMEKGELVGPMPIQRNIKLCLRCHLKLPSRPKNFPQIDLEDHVKGIANEHNPEICVTCHIPHNPTELKSRP